MKKTIIPVILLLLLLTVLIGYGIGRSTAFMTHKRQCSNHLIYAAHEPGANVGEDVDGTLTELTYSNIDAFLRAVSRTETDLSLFALGLDKMPCVKVTFADGAVIEVFDAGQKDGEDLVYIRHSWKNRKTTFRLMGYNTFARVRECIGIDGYNESNGIYSAG